MYALSNSRAACLASDVVAIYHCIMVRRTASVAVHSATSSRSSKGLFSEGEAHNTNNVHNAVVLRTHMIGHAMPHGQFAAAGTKGGAILAFACRLHMRVKACLNRGSSWVVRRVFYGSVSS